MGLSINITATAPATLGISEIETLVRRWHAIAGKFASEGLLAKVARMSDKADTLEQFASHYVSIPLPDDPDTSTGVSVPPTEGWMFMASVGEGCEPLALGLCRYPKSVDAPDYSDGGGRKRKRVPSGVGEGWHFSTSCKTQYASARGWEHFRRCHTAIIELAAAAETLGATVRIDDEGGWWPKRDDDALKRMLLRYNRLMAGFAGAMKDTLDADEDAPDGGGGGNAGRHVPLQAAIFEHPDFERLEAESQADGDDAKIREAIRKVKGELGH